MISTIIISILQMGKLRQKEIIACLSNSISGEAKF